jgi:16S rRNA G1207 methylase RsmC
MRYVSDHYFTREPGVTAQERDVEFTVAGRTFRLRASSGVFSADRLDLGTSVLLHKAPLPVDTPESPPRTLLDLGTGYGAIACVLASTATRSTVYAIDVNSRALDLVSKNAVANGLGGRIVAGTPDEIPAGVVFDEIWSNPPIRTGKAELHAMLDRWLRRLAPGGTAWLVVSKNLGGDSLHRWLTERGWSVERHASQKGYRVLRVSGSPPEPDVGVPGPPGVSQ